MHRLRILFLSLVVFVMASTPSFAIFGVGDIVFDPQQYAQSLISYMNQIRQYAVQGQQYATQLKQLAAQTRNLQNLDYMIDLAGLQDMQRIIQSARGIAGDYARLQSQFDQVYPEFSKFSTMSGKDFALKALEWNQETANSNRDAMDLISKTKDWFYSDSNDLRRLTVKANNVAGAKDGLQSIAQIAALQSKQLIQLQQTMSASARAEGTYMSQRAEQEAAARARLKKYAGDWEEDISKWRINQQRANKSLWERR